MGQGNDNDFTSSGTAGKFDLYLFAQSWAPRFCCVSAEKCATENIHQLADLSPHGLWPGYLDADQKGRTFPAYCSNEVGKNQVKGREEHEWLKHGTCTGVSRHQYFQEERKVMESEDLRDGRELLKECVEDSVATEELYEEFGGEKMVAFKVDKYCRLEEITTCWEKTDSNGVGNRVECPAHVLASMRNSAVLGDCKRVWLDGCGRCKFVDKKLLRFLKTGEGYTEDM